MVRSSKWLMGWVVACVLAVAPLAAAEDVPLKIKYTAPRAGSSNGQRIAVAFEDRRSSHLGGGTADVIGVVGERGDVVLVLEHATVEDVFYELTADALRSAGFRSEQGREDGLPTLLVILEDLELDGFTEFTVSMYVEFELLSVENEELLWDGSVAADGEVTLQWGARELWKGYRVMFEEALATMGRFFASPEFAEVLILEQEKIVVAEIVEAPVERPIPTRRQPEPVVERVVAAPKTEEPPRQVVTAPSRPVASVGDRLLTVVQMYYAYQGTAMTDDQRQAGVEAARALVDEGFDLAGLERAVVQVHREIPGARSMDFVRIVPAYVRALGDEFRGP